MTCKAIEKKTNKQTKNKGIWTMYIHCGVPYLMWPLMGNVNNTFETYFILHTYKTHYFICVFLFLGFPIAKFRKNETKEYKKKK